MKRLCLFLALTGALFAQPTAVIKSFGQPSWLPWLSMRTSQANRLDGTASTCAGGCTYAWSQTSGPTTLTFTTSTSSQPFTSTNVSFGEYCFQLIVTDSMSMSNTATLCVGAVNYSNVGVVTPYTSAITDIFGPKMAFGQNPWGYEDNRHYAAYNLQSQSGGYLYQYVNTETWSTKATGTVSYPFAGIGPLPGQMGTTLTGNITATSTSIPIADASKLSLGVLPTMILIGNSISVFGPVQEMVRICATTATSGAATLTVCYDGRGVQGLTTSFATAQPGSHSSGDTVGEYKITGTSTKFITDSSRPLCPVGSGPPGASVYSTGTVTLTASSTAVTGSGSMWTSAGIAGGNTLIMRINATHGGGTAFTSVALITTVGSNTSITLNRAVPSDVDSGPFTYNILSPRYVSLEATDPTGSPVNFLQNTMWCESDTAAYAQAAHDVGPFDTNTYSGMTFSYKDSLGAESAFGPNFYGTGLALLNFYARSGFLAAATSAASLDNLWVNDPELSNGWGAGGTEPLLQGGGVVGAIACLVANPDCTLTWANVREFGTIAANLASTGCNAYDTRDSGVYESYVALLARFDPDPTQNAIWVADLAAMYTRETTTVNAITGGTCRQADNSWANGFLWNGFSSPGMNVTHNSAVVTGTGFSSGLCNGVTGGTAAMTTGIINITAATGTFVDNSGFSMKGQIIITGTLSGAPYTFRTGYIFNSGTSVSLGGQWPGDNGTFAWEIASDQNWSTIAKSNDDPDLQHNYTCVFNSSTQITLNTPWVGATDLTADHFMYTSNLAGYGQEAFMLAGWKTAAFRWACLTDSRWCALATAAALWQGSTGYDPQSQGTNYGLVYESCVPDTTWANNDLMFRTDGCRPGAAPDTGIRAERAINGEGSSNALMFYYRSTGLTTYPSTAYGSIWGLCADTAAGYYCDSNYVRDENSDASLQAYKYAGFFFGIGNGDQWPAVLLGPGPGGSVFFGPSTLSGPASAQ